MNTELVHALGAAHYTDPARFEREQARIFRRTWQYAGHVSQLAKPGDCFALDLHGRSLFCVRDREGIVRAFYIWHAVDHRTTRVTRQWFAPDGASPDLAESLAEQDLRTTVAEDVRLVESVQRGLESGGYRPAPLVVNPAGGVNSEHSIRVLYEWLGEAMT